MIYFVGNMVVKNAPGSLRNEQLHPQSSMVCFKGEGARCSSVVRAFAHGAMGRRIDPL